MLSYSTAAAMRAMSAGLERVSPRTEALTGRHTPWDIGQTKAAIETSGDASHSPQPTNPPAPPPAPPPPPQPPGADPHEERVLAAIRFRRDDRHGQVEEIHRIDLHVRSC